MTHPMPPDWVTTRLHEGLVIPAHPLALTADVLFGVGGAITVTGLVLVIVSLKRKPKAGASARVPHVAPWAGRGGAGVATTMRF